MKNKFLKITIITIGLAIIIVIGFFLIQRLNNKQQNVQTQPAQITQFGQLPVSTDHFNISYSQDENTITIVPRIPFDMSQPPEYFLQTYWKDYNSYGQEALTWLDSHQINQTFRQNFGVTIEWWGQEWWPTGATAPTLN